MIGFTSVPGDGVDGYAREDVTLPATSFTHAPRGWSHAGAAMLTTAGRALFVDDVIKPSDTVLVQGTGAVSIFALQFAKMAGATVIATSSRAVKLERLRALGADHVINCRENPQWGTTAWELTGRRGMDHIIEVGGPSTLAPSMAVIRVAGHISVIGILTGVAGQLEVVPMLLKQFRLQSVLVGSRSDQQAMVRAFVGNGIRPVIDRSFALQDIVAAFHH
ncbi:zinc-dependent alcohol dehydrogenase family protein [Komagataeibacter europaeus]|uniref:zinc-dependent alcohol dehydrogenase family protein n=1 Tax=Komagataeibacter europaeus TaxID=33995 RepID=UPI002873AADA|nr:NAD(P)-dependent alcohol dehydrogenase [Komagataeibacter europaeus]